MLRANLPLLLRHVLTVAELNEAKCVTCLSAADRRVSTISAQMKCWEWICIYCYDMFWQVQNWMRLTVASVAQLPTRVCPQFEHEWTCIDNLNTNCWKRICINCYDMHLQLQNWPRLSLSRVSQLPTNMCPKFEHTWTGVHNFTEMKCWEGICIYCYDMYLQFRIEGD